MNRHDTTDLPASAWRKAGRCGPNGGNCVEVNRGGSATIGVRDSKNPDGTPLLFDPSGWRAFLSRDR